MGGKHHFLKLDVHQQGRFIRKIILHEDFNPDDLDNDIALVRVATPYNITDYVDTLCLPSSLVPDNTSCLTSGLGKTLG